MKIYTLVLVSYDYFRDESLIAASHDKEELLNRFGDEPDYPFYEYARGDETEIKLNERGSSAHYWIAEF